MGGGYAFLFVNFFNEKKVISQFHASMTPSPPYRREQKTHGKQEIWQENYM